MRLRLGKDPGPFLPYAVAVPWLAALCYVPCSFGCVCHGGVLSCNAVPGMTCLCEAAPLASIRCLRKRGPRTLTVGARGRYGRYAGRWASSPMQPKQHGDTDPQPNKVCRTQGTTLCPIYAASRTAGLPSNLQLPLPYNSSPNRPDPQSQFRAFRNLYKASIYFVVLHLFASSSPTA